jgi:hypothetical protein
MQKNNQVHVISFLSLRKSIGFLGILLPWACWGINTLFNKLDLIHNEKWAFLNPKAFYETSGLLKESISHFYYTYAGPLFTGILITVAVFLFSYKGYDDKGKKQKISWITDRWVTLSMGIAALGIVVFPTTLENPTTDNLYIFGAQPMAGRIHLFFAAVFFLLMVVLCLVNFRRQSEEKDFGKDKYDLVFRLCGYSMLICIAAIALNFKFEWVMDGNFTFWMEAIALQIFGIAWLVKGRILNPIMDKKKEASS